MKAMVRAKGPDRTILVTDAIAAAGCAPGRYRMGAVECELGADGRVSLPGTPFLAGSSLTLDRAIVNTVRFTGLPIEAVIPMASIESRSVSGHDDCRHGERGLGRRRDVELKIRTLNGPDHPEPCRTLTNVIRR